MTRVPPYDEGAESALVGAMLVDASVVALSLETLAPPDFYVPRYRTLYAALCDLYGSGQPIDTVTVSGALQASNQLEAVGGNGGLIELIASAGYVGNASGYIRRVADCSSYRRLIDACSTGLDSAYDQTMPPGDLVDWLGRVVGEAAVADLGVVPDDLWVMDDFLEGPLSDRPAWVVPGLLRVGWRVMVVAAEGVGKTVLFRQIGLAAAQGIHPLHFQPIDPVRVLIVDLENPDDSIIDVCQPIQQQVTWKVGEAYDRDRAWLWHRPSGINLRSRRDRGDLESVIAHVRPDLVCLGPIYKAYRVEARESDELAAAEVMTVFDDLRTRYRFALLLEHHAPKGMGGSRQLMPYGSSLWLRWPEVGLKLVPREEDNSVMTVGRWRGDRLTNSWPMELERSQPWPWVGVWPTGTFTDPKTSPVPTVDKREYEDDF